MCALLEKAFEREQEQRAWQQWLLLYPHMAIPSPHTKNNKPLIPFQPFSEFYRKATQKISVRTDEEILADVMLARKGR